MSGRVLVAIEGKATEDGRLLEPGALHFLPGFTPVLMFVPEEGRRRSVLRVVGQAALFQREDDGAISAEIRMLDGSAPPQDLNAHIEVDTMIYTVQNRVMRISSAVLRTLFLSDDPGGWHRA